MQPVPSPASRRHADSLRQTGHTTWEEASMEATRDPHTGSRLSAAHTDRIEKGWTAYDALNRPLGNVTDVDTSRGQLRIDGRSVGFTEFEVPLAAVRDARDNDVYLALTVDPDHLVEGTP